MRRFLGGVAAALVVGLAVAVTPAAGSAQVQKSWDHASCTRAKANAAASAECTPVFTVDVEPGETIQLTIRNTCPDEFTYSVVAVRRPADDVGVTHGAPPRCDGQRAVDIVHDPQYGGYIVSVTRKEGSDAALGDARITIAVRTSEWRVGFAGGFTVNGLRDPAFALRQLAPAGGGTGTATRFQLVEQKSRRDDAGRSVVSFVHVRHDRWNLGFTPAITFGLGVEPDRTGDYYLGASWLWGDRGALTLGGVLGQIASPPAGRSVGDTLEDANALANLGRRRVGKLFLGVSYRFLGNGGDELRKPFQGQSPPQTASDEGARAATGTPSGGPPAGGDTAVELTVTDTLVRRGEESKPIRVRAQWAKGGTVRWSVEGPAADRYSFDGPGRLDDEGGASATVTPRSDVAPGKVTMQARVCEAVETAPRCATQRFTMTVTS